MTFLLSSQNVLQYLADLELCSQESLDYVKIKPQKFTKNLNLLVEFSHQKKLLVKQEYRCQTNQRINEFGNEWQFHQLLKHFPDLGWISDWVSQIVHFDRDNSILIYNYLSQYLDLGNFYDRQPAFPKAIAGGVGTILAKLHRTTFNHQEHRDFIERISEGQFRYQFGNPVKGIGRISPEIFGLVPANALKFFLLYQRYESLATAIADLETQWYPCCLTHNDLKLNNILVHQDSEQLLTQGQPLDSGILRLIDWERCAWGDPAFDLGSLVASYLRIWLSNLVVDPAIELEESLRMAVIPLEVIQPSIIALLQAYLHTFSEILEYRFGFLQRVIQFAGLGLIQQIEAMIHYQKSFNNTGICLLQVAKSLLCRPEQSIVNIFGVPEAELINLSCAAV